MIQNKLKNKNVRLCGLCRAVFFIFYAFGNGAVFYKKEFFS